MFFVVFELFAVEFGIVHLTEYVDHLLEEASALLEIVKFEAAAAYSEYQLDHIFLSLDRAEGIDCVECVLLEDDIVDEFGFPEYFVISHRHSVVAEDVDLLVGFTSLADDVLELAYLFAPTRSHGLVQIFLDFRIFEIFGVGVDRVHSRIALLVCTLLLKGVEAAGRLLGGLCDRFLEVTSCRGYGSDEGHRTCLSVVQDNHSGTGVEVGNDG